MKSDPSENFGRLYEFASAQGGYFTAQQAKSAGYYMRLQHYHRQRGNWLAVGWGIFRLRNFPSGRWEDLIQWSLWSRNQKGIIPAVVSHQSAAAVHEIGDYLPAKIHMTVPGGFRKPTPDACILHKGRLNPEEIQNQQGFRVTTPFRTLQDLAKSTADYDQLIRAADDATRRGLITQAERKKLKIPS